MDQYQPPFSTLMSLRPTGPVRTNHRFLILIATYNRALSAAAGVASMWPFPENAEVHVFDDHSTEWDPASYFPWPVHRSNRNLGTHGTSFRRISYVRTRMRDFDYVYLVDSDMYHPQGFWEYIDEFLTRYRPDISSAYRTKKNPYRVIDNVRLDQRLPGSSLFLRPRAIEGAYRTLRRTYFDWDNRFTNSYVAPFLSPALSMVEHMGITTGEHADYLKSDPDVADGYIRHAREVLPAPLALVGRRCTTESHRQLADAVVDMKPGVAIELDMHGAETLERIVQRLPTSVVGGTASTVLIAAACQQRLATIALEDARRLPYRSGSTDIMLTCSPVLFNKNVMTDVLIESRRILKDHGVFVLYCSANSEELLERINAASSSTGFGRTAMRSLNGQQCIIVLPVEPTRHPATRSYPVLSVTVAPNAARRAALRGCLIQVRYLWHERRHLPETVRLLRQRRFVAAAIEFTKFCITQMVAFRIGWNALRILVRDSS